MINQNTRNNWFDYLIVYSLLSVLWKMFFFVYLFVGLPYRYTFSVFLNNNNNGFSKKNHSERIQPSTFVSFISLICKMFQHFNFYNFFFPFVDRFAFGCYYYCCCCCCCCCLSWFYYQLE